MSVQSGQERWGLQFIVEKERISEAEVNINKHTLSCYFVLFLGSSGTGTSTIHSPPYGRQVRSTLDSNSYARSVSACARPSSCISVLIAPLVSLHAWSTARRRSVWART